MSYREELQSENQVVEFNSSNTSKSNVITRYNIVVSEDISFSITLFSNNNTHKGIWNAIKDLPTSKQEEVLTNMVRQGVVKSPVEAKELDLSSFM